MNGITVLNEEKLDFEMIHNEILKECKNTILEADVMTNGKSIHRWYFYNLPDLASEIFDKKDLTKISNKEFYCYELSFRNNKCPVHILKAIKTLYPSSIVYDDVLDRFIEVEKYIDLIA